MVALNGPALRRTPSWPASQSEDPSREMRVRLDQEFMQGVARQSRELGGPVMDAPTNSEAAVNPFWSPDVKRSAVVNQAIPESGLARPSGLPETEPEGDGCQMATMSPDQAVERLRLKVLREAEELFLSEVRRMKGAEDGGSYHSASSGEARKKGLVGEQKRTSAGQAGGALPADVRHGNLPVVTMPVMGEHNILQAVDEKGYLADFLEVSVVLTLMVVSFLLEIKAVKVYLVVSLEVIMARTMVGFKVSWSWWNLWGWTSRTGANS